MSDRPEFIEEPEMHCWLWQRSKLTAGYGQVGRGIPAHRVVYEELVGPIPEGLQLDHLCRVRACVNPGHLEPVTRRENLLRGESPAAKHARKTHCPKGHPFEGENLYVDPRGQRGCKTCRREQLRAFRSRSRSKGSV